MEEESKMSFFKKWKTSIFGLEEYQKLAIQKLSKTILYLAILILIFASFFTLSITYRFHQVIQNVAKYIDNNVETLDFKNGVLSIQAKDKPEEAIIVNDEQYFNGKIIIDTKELSKEKIDEYKQEISGYYNGILVLKDEIVLKTNGLNVTENIPLKELSDEIHLVNLEKKDLIDFMSGPGAYALDLTFFITLFIVIFINQFATTLLDAVLFSIIGYILGIVIGLRIRYSAAYNIAIYSLTLPITLQLIYMIVNSLTGYTIHYFSVMYTAITCIYIFTSILMIKSDIIKRQMELSKIIEEQEKIKQEMERQEQEKREQEEKERVRKKDEKKRKEESGKAKEKKKELPKENNEPEPQANIKPGTE